MDTNVWKGSTKNASVVASAEDTNVVTITIQLQDVSLNALTKRNTVLAYLSDDAAGDSIAATAPDGNIVIATDGLLIPIVANKAFFLTSEADGDIDLTLTESGTATWYLVVVLPKGDLVISNAITLAA